MASRQPRLEPAERQKANERFIEEILEPTPHTLLWYDLGDGKCKRVIHDSGLALVLYVSPDKSAHLVFTQADQAICNYPYVSPRTISLPPYPQVFCPTFGEWSVASTMPLALLSFAADLDLTLNAEEEDINEGLHPLSPTTPQIEVLPPTPPFERVFFGPIISKDDEFYGYVEVRRNAATGGSLMFVANGSVWTGVATVKDLGGALPKDLIGHPGLICDCFGEYLSWKNAGEWREDKWNETEGWLSPHKELLEEPACLSPSSPILSSNPTPPSTPRSPEKSIQVWL